MEQILVLSEEITLFGEVDKNLKKNNTFTIHVFRHGLEMVNFSLSNYARLVILDMDLLQEETLHMIQILHSIHPDVRILLILSEENMPLCSSALSLGVYSYQVKPISASGLVEFIASIIPFTRNPA